MAVPLDQLYIKVYSEQSRKEIHLPALHPKWTKNVKFVLYQAPPLAPEGSTEQGALLGEYKERLTFITDDLHWLLTLSHDKFWCQIIFDESIHRCVDSYLRYAPRCFDVIYTLSEDLQTLHAEVHRLFFMVCLRMATHKESKDKFITPEEFGKIIYENYIFDIPKLMDLSVLYGAGNGPLVTKMINNIFVQQPNYEEDLKAIVPTVLQVFQNISQQCGLSPGSSPNTPLKLNAHAGTSALVAMDTAKFQDVVFYLSDTASTLWSFLEVYPSAAKVFCTEEFLAILGVVAESLFPWLCEAIRDRPWDSQDHGDLLQNKVLSAQMCLLKTYRQIICKNYLEPLLKNCSAEEAENHIEGYLQTVTGILGERRFVAQLEHLFPFREDRDILSQSSYPVDDTRLQFVQDAVNEAYATYGRRSKPSDDHTVDGATVSEEPFPEAGAEYEAPDYDELGACAPRVTGIELESLITSVKDLLPDLGEGFIELCLEETNYSVENVINMLLEDKLPASLQGHSRSLPRERRKPEPVDEGQVLLSGRKNVFDNDEFDVFSRDHVDTSKIHRGKMPKDTDTDALLDDKSSINKLRPLYQKYGGEFVESMYDHQGGDYDDEYDDTYDSNLIGATDADSADELTARRPFTIPRVLGGTAADSNKDTNGEESEEESEGRDPSRDHFLEDPAKIRQRQEERRALKQATHRKKQAPRGQGQGKEGQGQKKYDVEGNPKGQGQSDDVVKNRSWKEKNKATRVHHNRKALSDKKRKF